jgi:GNAT superfamily N-acetyltransferase
MSGLIAFVFGWFASAPFAWPYIKEGFDGGDPSKGVFRFIVVVFTAGIGCGLIGMLLGAIGGNIWEWYHRSRRARTAAGDLRSDMAGSRATYGLPVAPAVPKIPLPPLRYDAPALDVDAYLALLRLVSTTEYDRTHTSAALECTVNICAWNGDKLVGVARVLSDGYFFAALAEIVVDPELQKRGLGRELMNRAFEKTPRGALLIGSPLNSSAFFDHIGCDRGPTGFTMRRAARGVSEKA